MYRLFLSLFSLFLFALATQANNLTITNTALSSIGANQYITCTISWENSWKEGSIPNNYDAIWLIVKQKDCAGLQWKHVNVSPQETDHSASSPLFVDAYADKKGVMVYRSSIGFGNITNATIQIKLDSFFTNNYEYKVVGIEMVYIPQSSFYLGDGGANYCFKMGASLNPYLIANENSITLNPSGSNLWIKDNFGTSFTLPATFPKGFNAFYCMKYEISQGLYATFLNTITQDAFNNRYDASYFGAIRYTITGMWPSITATAPDRACNWLSMQDVCAFMDWAALSPMDEFEFEKVCRGTSSNNPILGEYAWGGNQVTDANTITNGTDGLPTETVSDVIATGTGLANYGNNIILGPLRCGFAAKSNATRFKAGATYYGVMEMSGNLFELCFNADSSLYAKGYEFDGTHGDGELSITPSPGNANQSWPLGDYFSITARGGAWSSPLSNEQLKVSDRTFFNIMIGVGLPTPDAQGRSAAFGGRGVSRR